jgi:hypothetical protein
MVYVVQEQRGKNIAQATKHGEIKVLLEQGSQVTFSAGFVTNELRRKLSDFNDSDFLLLMGDPVAIGIAVAIAAYWNQGKVKMLKWDKQDKMYYPVSINLHPKTEVLDEPTQQ